MGCGYAKFSTTNSCLKRNLKLDNLEIVNDYLLYLIEHNAHHNPNIQLKFYLEPFVHKLCKFKIIANVWEIGKKSVILKVDKMLVQSITKNVLELFIKIPPDQKELLTKISELELIDPSHDECVIYMNHIQEKMLRRLDKHARFR